MRKAIAIDFDGCLCTDAYPEIGEPIWPVIYRAKAEQRAGAGLILWTCREGQILQDAIAACEVWGLTFDAVNESLPDWIEALGTQPRKVGASEYWDDKAVSPTNINGTYVSVEWFNQVNAELQAYKEAKDAGRLLILPDAKYTDSDGEGAVRTAMWTCGYKNNPVTRYTADAIAEKLCREAKDENPPLALEELREMDGDAVWIVRLDAPVKSWRHLIDGYNQERLLVRGEYGGYMRWDEMGTVWLAYRRKPEEWIS